MSVLEVLIGLCRDEGLRDREVDDLEQVVKHLLARGHSLLDEGHALDPGPKVRLQFVEGVELARHLRKLVVGVGQ